jgi:hypothetical protein
MRHRVEIDGTECFSFETGDFLARGGFVGH